MGFAVDKVSEDSFYENLLLGVSKILEKSLFVSNLWLERIPGVRQVDIRNWEHNHGVILPEDLRAFYSSTNGFLYKYQFSYDVNNCEENKKHVQTGSIEINPLEYLSLIYDYDTNNTNAEITKTDNNNYKLTLTKDSKVFELANVYNGYGKVVIVYLNNYSIPNIWYYSSKQSFHYLADDFTTYFRMSIAHLGIPCWQCIYTNDGLPEWSKEIFHLIAPGVLNEDKQFTTELPPQHRNDIHNKIDPIIFASPAHNSSAVLNITDSSAKISSRPNKPASNDKKTKYPTRSNVKTKLKGNS